MAGGIFIPRKEAVMEKTSIQRASTTAGTEIQFDLIEMNLNHMVSGSYLIKNFTDGDIYVGFVSGNKEKMSLIPSETAQVFSGSMIEGNILYVIPAETSNKGVEVQCLRW